MNQLVQNIMNSSFLQFVTLFEVTYIIQIVFFILIFTGLVRPTFFEYLQKRKIQDKQARKKQVDFEKRYARKNIFLIPLMSVPAVWLLYTYGIYSVLGTFDGGRIFIDIIVLTIFTDTYFYWTHRAMHWKKVYKKIHAVHHVSHTPTAYSSLTFDIGEVFVNFTFLTRYTLIMAVTVGNVHFISVLIYVVIFNLRNTYIHCGYHGVGHGIRNSRLGKYIARSEWHDKHHEYNNGNFALYFTFWDRVCGTVAKR